MSTKEVDKVLAGYPDRRREFLIPILQEIQDVCGYLSHETVLAIGRHLGLPASKVYGVATFYNQFRFQAPGLLHVQCCRGTACHVKNSANILEALKRTLKIQPGQTTKDGMFSLEVVACMGACGLAPLISVNGEFYGGVTPDGIKKILDECRKKVVAHV
ncbi:MAG: NADH-quinone oxidoreductase subunit NuoE [Candidatus Eisenbacteria bacterium]